MSARHLRRKIGDGLLASAAIESSEEDEVVVSPVKPMNMFDMLGGSDEESQVPEPEPEEDEPSPSSSVPASTKSSANQSKAGSNASKNAKKRNKKKPNKASAAKESDDELDALLATVPQVNVSSDVNAASQRDSKLREILRVNASLLDPDAEMQRLFGADVVPNRGVAQVGPRNNPRGGRHGPGITVRKKTVMIKPRANWPPVGGKNDGLEMVLHETKRGVNYFKMTWDRTYQKAQDSFHRCVETGDPNSLAALMRTHPYHVDTLLQLHDAFQMTEEKDAALDLLERLIYRFESSLHPKFNIFAPDAASSIRFLYQEPENRSFMLGIGSYIQEIGKKGCSQTALEWSKLLLSLDLSDPLGVLLLIDHFALRRREHVWLLEFYHSPLFQEHDLSILPNFVYSIALAAFYHRKNLDSSETSDKDTNQEYSDINPTQLMHNAMAMHPSLFTGLVARLAAGSIRAKGQNVLELPHFANASQNAIPLVNVLCHLYIERNHAMWKDPICIQWLKECAISFSMKLSALESPTEGSTPTNSSASQKPASVASNPADPNDLTPEEWMSKIESYAVLVQALTENPERIHRHVMLCEFNSVIRMLPSEVLREGFHIYRPGELGSPQASSSAAQQAQRPNEQSGAAGQIARILDYLVPFQADTQQVQSLLNLIGYQMGGNDDEPQDDE
jgi:hypothetical protein